MTEKKVIILEFRNEQITLWGIKLAFIVYSVGKEGRL